MGCELSACMVIAIWARSRHERTCISECIVMNIDPEILYIAALVHAPATRTSERSKTNGPLSLIVGHIILTPMIVNTWALKLWESEFFGCFLGAMCTRTRTRTYPPIAMAPAIIVHSMHDQCHTNYSNAYHTMHNESYKMEKPLINTPICTFERDLSGWNIYISMLSVVQWLLHSYYSYNHTSVSFTARE